MLRIFVFLLSIFMIFAGKSQDQNTADSLKRVLSMQMDLPDSVRFSLLKSISFNETNPDEAIIFSNLLIQEAQQDSLIEWLYHGYFQKGNAFRLKADFQDAFSCYFKSLEFAQQLQNQKRIASSYISIADTYSSIDNSSNAMEYYNRGIAVFRDLNDSVSLATALLNAGDEFFNAGKLDSAAAYFEESGEIFNLIDYKIGQAYNLGNVGLVFAEQGRHDLAEERINRASSLLKELGDYYPISVYNYYLSDIYVEKNDFERALKYAESGYQIALSEGLKEQVKDGAIKLAELFNSNGDPGKAYDFLRQHIAYRDSINSNEVVQEMADLQREYEVRQKQIEIDLAKQEKRNQQIISISLVIILALLVILLFTLYRNNIQRKRINQKLQHLNETKDKFFSIISHDLRGPVSAFYGITRIIKMYVSKKQYDQLDDITDQIDHSVKNLGDLLDNLLNWAAQQRGQLPYKPEHLNMTSLFEYVADVFADVAKAKDISFEKHSDDSLFIFADENASKTILRNLVSNAIKFSPAGSHIILRAFKEKNNIKICVQDSGIGIPEEKMESLFGFKAKKSTYGTAGEKGLGLGLQLVYEFVKLNKGTVDVESQQGKGTQFTVAIPMNG